jgi:hypothetical protein
MRWSLSVSMAIGVIAAIEATPAVASPTGNSPYCLKGCSIGGNGGVGDCSFSSYAQCQASAAGQSATCSSNPYLGNADSQPARAHYSQRRY